MNEWKVAALCSPRLHLIVHNFTNPTPTPTSPSCQPREIAFCPQLPGYWPLWLRVFTNIPARESVSVP